jgi:hypothetical protein
MVNLRIWPLFLTRELHFETNLPAPKKDILRVMHEPQNALRNNPLIFYVEQDRDKSGELVAANLKYEATKHGFPMDPDPEDPAWFTIRETVRATGGISETKDFETEIRVLYWRTEHGGGVFIIGKAWTTVHHWHTIEQDGDGAAIYKKHMVFKVSKVNFLGNVDGRLLNVT